MNRLRNALETDRFELLYQPLMHIKTGVVSHYETLLRLPTEDGVLRPESFLPAAFRFGLMADIDRWVLKRVVQSLAELLPSMPELKLSTNLSGFAFEDEGLAAYLRALLKEHDVAGDRLVLEITEQLAVRFAANTDKQIAMLRDLGCQLAIDDFGSGYSSFSYLKRLPVDYLKIDGSFIKRLDSRSRRSSDGAHGRRSRARGGHRDRRRVREQRRDARAAREVRHRLCAGLLHRQAGRGARALARHSVRACAPPARPRYFRSATYS